MKQFHPLTIERITPETKDSFSEDLVKHSHDLGSDVAFLQKPFSLDVFAAQVRKVLDGA